jgi:hypothetical protein
MVMTNTKKEKYEQLVNKFVKDFKALNKDMDLRETIEFGQHRLKRLTIENDDWESLIIKNDYSGIETSCDIDMSNKILRLVYNFVEDLREINWTDYS